MKSCKGLALVVATVAALALLLTTWGFAALSKGTEAPAFKAKTINGKAFALKDLRGRVVLLDFWATWCPPCRAETPQLEKLWQEYRDRGLIVVGIALESGGAPGIRKFTQQNKLTYWQVSDDEGAIAEKYGIRPIPTTYIIDTKGIIRLAQVGYGPGLEKLFAREIEKLLPSPDALKALKPIEDKPGK
jgi:peroxiredoxin